MESSVSSIESSAKARSITSVYDCPHRMGCLAVCTLVNVARTAANHTAPTQKDEAGLPLSATELKEQAEGARQKLDLETPCTNCSLPSESALQFETEAAQ